MIILNINGPINSGKSTVSKILAQKLPKSIFVEVDDLATDSEFPDFTTRINERLHRLYAELELLISDNKYDYVIFAYPICEESYKRVCEIVSGKAKFIVVTLNPQMDICLTNRGTRELNEWEKNRIRQMYDNGFNSFSKSDIITDNTNQTPEQTALNIILKVSTV